jgi:hypothetical protein
MMHGQPIIKTRIRSQGQNYFWRYGTIFVPNAGFEGSFEQPSIDNTVRILSRYKE